MSTYYLLARNLNNRSLRIYEIILVLPLSIVQINSKSSDQFHEEKGETILLSNTALLNKNLEPI